MKSKTNTFQLALAGMLIAIGIVIPMFSPIKIIIEPASFTLASHVPVFIAMFISPMMAAAVALGTTLGFLLGGFPLTVVLRALTHVIFATIAPGTCRSTTASRCAPSALAGLLLPDWPAARGVRGADRAAVLHQRFDAAGKLRQGLLCLDLPAGRRRLGDSQHG